MVREAGERAGGQTFQWELLVDTHTGGSVRENFRQPKNISLASLQPKIIISFYTLTSGNEIRINNDNLGTFKKFLSIQSGFGKSN